MYGICKTIHPTTEVECSTYCHFFNLDERNLLTAGGNQLKVYRLIRNPSKPADDGHKYESLDYAKLSGTLFSDNIKLECRQTFILNGKVDSVNSISFAGANRDCVMLSFADAKVSIVEYDPHTHDLKTISMHYFEEDDMKQGYASFSRPSVVRVDPENRCAALLIYGRSIVIIPFRKEMVVDDNDNIPFIPGGNNNLTTNKRSPVLPSYKLDLSPELYGVNIVNIIDIQFLYNYYEPTLLILYEPIRTWSGRIAVRQDTVSMITLSLDVYECVHPHIWSLTNLPFNTFAALPVPKPIGGVLIFAINSLIHLNQGLPPFGISLNAFNDGNTSFPLKTYADLTLSLDGCQACFITNNKILLSLNNGDLYMLNLHNDMTRSIRTFNFTRLASTVICTTLTRCEEGFLFLGSRLSHSLLLYYFEKVDEQKTEEFRSKSVQNSKQNLTNLIRNISGFDELGDKSEDEYLYGIEYCRSLKKLKMDQEEAAQKVAEANQLQHALNNDNNMMTGGNIVNGDEAIVDSVEIQSNGNLNGIEERVEEPEEVVEVRGSTDHFLEVYESDEKQPYFVKLCDTIYNIGPCASICLGEPNIVCDNLSNSKDFDVELVTNSGYAKSGGLTIMQRTIKPQVETTIKLPGYLNAWTVYGPNFSQEEGLNHEFLILTQEDSTTVFQISHEINELDQSGFITQSSTVFAGNLGENRYILQVCAYSVRLLDGTHELQHVPLDLGSPISFASLADPHVVLMTTNGRVVLLHLKIELQKGTARLVIAKPDLSTGKSKITALCIYKDVSGMFSTETKGIEDRRTRRKAKTTSTTVENNKQQTKMPTLASATTVDEEDELLYGDSTVYFLNNDADQDEDEDDEKEDLKLITIDRKEPTFWLFLVRENGVLEIYNQPEFRLVYLVKNFPMGPRVLVDSVQLIDHSYQSQTDTTSMPITAELLVIGMGLNQSRPHLFARFDDELFIYEVFPFYEIQVDNHLKIRFKKHMSHSTFIRHPNMFTTTTSDDDESETKSPPLPTGSWLRPFKSVAGFSGIFMCGPIPVWFFMTFRGELRSHNMEVDGAITCFAMFNNSNCPDGFLYFNYEEELRFCQLPNRLEIDAVWPYKQVPVRDTVHYVSYHLESKTYAIVKSKSLVVDKIVRVGGEEKDTDPIDFYPRYIPCTNEQFQLELLSPVNWEVIPSTTIDLDEWEHVTCLRNVLLSSEGTSSGLKGYLALGTNYNYGEDVNNRGRIWIVDVIEVVPEPGKPLTKNKIKIVYCKEQKGPVTTLCQVKGYLLSAIGQKIYIWQLKESQLIGIAFIDTQIYVHMAVSLRNLILISDVYKSISLLRYQEETRTLSLVSRDPKCLQVYSCEYFIDNSQMAFIVSDSEQNLILYSYQPETSESHGGTKLIRRADFHLGSHVNSFFRIRCNVPSKNIDNRLKQTYFRKHLTMFATLNGSVGYLLPITEKTYRRLLMLQNLLTTNIQHCAGLNPKAYRMIKTHKLELANASKNILDGDLLFRFFNLSLNEKMELSRKIGTSTKQVSVQTINVMNNKNSISLYAGYRRFTRDQLYYITFLKQNM